ncbi:MAG TPA: DnaJ domain-containing protein, partial [Pirellulales bacterium]|nr:DnaJ domain-containing protein [Pirellulales bacterium]
MSNDVRMAEDYYKTLGLDRDASQADIDKAYAKLARKYHPDVNPDDKTAKKKFQAVQAAYDVLKDPSKREMYNRYGSSFEQMGGGGPQTGPQWRTAGGGPGGAGGPEFDFSQIFGGGEGG